MDNNETTVNESGLPKRGSFMGFTTREIWSGIIYIISLVVIVSYLVFIFIPDVDETLTNLEIELAQLELDFSTSSERISQFEQDFANYSEQITQLKSELETYIEQIERLKGERAANIEQIKQLEADLAIVTEQKIQFENEAIAKSDRITQLEDELTSNSEKIAELEQESATKSDEISRLREELSTKNQEITELLNSTDAEFVRINQLEQELNSKNELITQLENESSDKSDEIVRLNIEIRKLMNQLSELEEVSSNKSDEIARLNIELRKSMNQNNNLVEKLAELEELLDVPVEVSDWPPFINIDEVSKFSFEIGQATLSPNFEKFLIETVATQIKLLAEEDNAKIVEVVGHTDDLPITRGATGFDDNIIDALAGSFPIEELLPTDNAGLGIARAVSVINVLKKIDGLSGLTFVPLSGGQLVIPGDNAVDSNLTGDSEVRRRIEIRIRGESGTKYFGFRN